MLKYGVALLGMEPFTINLMTLLGLSLSVGVVVDDAILVLENIYRHRELGADRKTAALVGAKEITFAAMAATFSIMAIFLPVAFMKGTIGKFFFQFGVTVSVAVFLSLLSALTLTPMLCAFFLNLHEKKPSRPRAFGLPLALVIGLFAVGVGCGLRALGHFAPEAAPLGWWPALLVQPLASSLLGEPVPSYAAMTLSLKWWGVAMVVEFFVAALLVKFGNQLYWLLDRFFLGPVLLRPTDWFLDRMTTAYAWTLRWSLHFWYVVLGVGFALIAVAVAMLWLGILGMELTPSEDQSRFVAHIVCPVGSSIDYIDNRLQECERKLQVMPEVASFLTTVATEPGQLMNEADIFVQLVPREERHGRNQTYVMRKVREALNQVPDIRVVLRDQSTEGFTAQRGEPVDFALQGDWEHMPTIAYWFLEEMTASRKFQDIDTDYRPGMPEVRIHPKREKLALVNMSMENVANSLSLHVGGQRIAKFTEGGRRYDIRMRMQLPQRTSTHQLESILLRSGDNRLVPLVDIASLETVSTLPVINRYSHQRKIQITASPADGVSQGEAIDYFQKVIRPKIEERYKTWQQNRAGRDFTLTELGNAQAMRETIDSLVFALVFGVAIAYMILGVQFNSFIHPLTVLMAMPFAVTGALVTLWATGDTLNMMSMIGLILLMGLVKKNSIILVDYTNQLREEGLSVKDAVLKACPVRLRPILMTSIATIAGAIPAAVGLGPGAETRAPMARSIIGGIILSTLVTLVLVPVFYIVVERLREAAKRLIIAPADPAPTAPS
jgi:multidrug efflux pump subunit AcrB